MELMLTRTEDGKPVKDVADFFFYGFDDELEYPLIGEFKALLDILEPDSDAKTDVCYDLRSRRAIQKAISITILGKELGKGATWRFFCKMCSKIFTTYNACEKHIARKRHFYSVIEEKELSSSDRKCHVVEVRRSLGQDYLPIRYGNWSKVICEFRHRYCQVEQGHYHDSSSVNSPCTHIDEEETHPKISSEEEHISNVIKKLDDYFQTKGMPVQTSSPSTDKAFTFKGQDGEPLTADSGIHSAATGSPLDLSQNFLDFDLGKDPSETLQGKFGVTKVYIERYQCEDCGAIFANMEEASGHLENHLSVSKGALHDDEHSSVSGGDTLEVHKKGETSVGKMQDSEGSDNCEDDNCEGNKQSEDDEMTSTTHEGNKDYSEEKPLLEDNETIERNGLDLVINAKWQEAEKSALDSSETTKKRKRKGKKRKKNKPWRLIKRAFMLTIIILF